MSDLMLDVGQANELKLAFRRADFSNEDIKRLCEGSVLAGVRSVLRGHAAINVVEHVIDCDADPFVPEGWMVEEHQKGGQWKFDLKEVELFLSSGQKGRKYIEGNKLRKELAKKPVFNANVLDYLLANPHLIPEEWKGKYDVFFWGTVYRHRDGDLRVRYLYWDDGRWFWSFSWLGNGFFGDDPAAGACKLNLGL
ncbi:hypothetical protein HKL94_01115 [Candidatus Parcubacteria bacterium]|nr:hypothetical protein [Candidatus Parcubacteria bacterium]